MNELAAWIQNNWYALGSLLIQVAFLSAGVWFARTILRTIRASQEQVGALLKLSVTSATAERHSPNATADRFANESPYWLTPGETPTASSPEFHQSSSSLWHGMIEWLQTPMSSVSPWRKALLWLQAPAGH